jgi:hypothetical protein
MSIFPVARAAEIGRDEPVIRWLIEGLWAESTVGIVGGEPKCCKSFLALDMAIAVASGRPCLGHFAVKKTGRVLLYAAEDAPAVVRRRLDGICAVAGASLADLDIQVITAPSLRVDLVGDQARLRETVEQLKPELLILDPFVRLHRIDENVSSEVVPILSYLRELQRCLGVAVVVVHHAKKGGAKIRAGQALRGSSEFHAWTDSILYLRRRVDDLELIIEHRAAPSEAGIPLELRTEGPRLIRTEASTTTTALPENSIDKVESVLRDLREPISLNRLRTICRMRMVTLSDALEDLVGRGRVEKTAHGYALLES